MDEATVAATATNGLDGSLPYACSVFTMNAHCCRCIICQLVVKGQSMFCLACSHGGHTHHMREWFSSNNVCPTGCGCRCLFSQSVNIMPRGGSTPSPLGALLAGGNGFVGQLSSQLCEEPIVI